MILVVYTWGKLLFALKFRYNLKIRCQVLEKYSLLNIMYMYLTANAIS